MAFDIAGARLVRRIQQGSSEIPAGLAPSRLPSAAAALSSQDCLLAVAVSEGAREPIRLTAVGGKLGDLRDKPFAAVEICAQELPRGKTTVEDLALQSSSGGKARWALYLTRSRQPETDTTAKEGGPK